MTTLTKASAPVMPAFAGIHDFAPAALDAQVVDTRACRAGMTRNERLRQPPQGAN